MHSFLSPRSRAPDRKSTDRPRRPVIGARPVPAAGRSPATARAAGGLPERLQTVIEAMSGFSLADVVVHRNSAEPARLGAAAFTRGSQVHVAPGQERHLPHEAWHVVQQMQGRVSATTQMKGVGVNEDAGLEAEADRIGAAAENGSRPTSIRDLRAAVTTPTVTQRVVEVCEQPLVDSPDYSPILREYIGKEESYVLRDDFHDKLGQSPIHLIDKRMKYLLGEWHDYEGDKKGTSKWMVETMYWQSIDKMTEGRAFMPHEPDDAAGRFDEVEFDAKNQALESTHAYLLGRLLQAHVVLNSLCSESTKLFLAHDKSSALIEIAEIQEDLQQIGVMRAYYDNFVTSYEEVVHGSKPRLKLIYEFSTSFRAFDDIRLSELRKHLTALDEELRKQEPGKAGLSGDRLKTAIAYIDMINNVRESLPVLAGDLVKIIDIKAETEVAGITALLPYDTKAGEKKPGEEEAQAAANEARERAMVANVRAAAAPLLVSIGNFHVVDVASEVGGVAVDMNASLESVTKKPES